MGGQTIKIEQAQAVQYQKQMICTLYYLINPTSLSQLSIIIISHEEPMYSLRYVAVRRPKFEEQFEDSEANHSEVNKMRAEER